MLFVYRRFGMDANSVYNYGKGVHCRNQQWKEVDRAFAPDHAAARPCSRTVLRKKPPLMTEKILLEVKGARE